MVTCKDCVHYDVCASNEYVFSQFTGEIFERLIYIGNRIDCKRFKDKSRYIELPCNVGDTVYCIDYILEITEKCIVYGFQIFANGKIQLLVDNGETKFVTPNWYTTKEEAEKALKESEQNDKL